MDIFLAAMAFAVLMIVFRTTVTLISEAHRRIFAGRADILAKSALQFLKDDPAIQNAIKGWFETLDEVHLKPALQELRENAETYAAKAGVTITPQDIDAFQSKIDALEEALAAINGDATLDEDGKMARRQQAYAALDDDVKSGLAQRAESLATGLRDEAREILVRNPAIPAAADWLGKPVEGLRRFFQRDNSKRLETPSTYSFLQRLATTQIGRRIAAAAEEYTLRGLTMGFERYVAASNEVFRKRAQAMTMAISIIFAFMFNIAAFRLYDYLLNNPTVREELVADIDRVVAENLATIQAYETVLRQQEAAATATDVPPETVAAVAPEPVEETPVPETITEQPALEPGSDASGDDAVTGETGEQGPDSGGGSAVGGGSNAAGGSGEGAGDGPGETSASAVPEELQDAINSVRTAREQIEQLSTIGNLPIGWDQFPNPEYQCIIPAPVLSGYRTMRNGLSAWWQGLGRGDAAEKPAPENGGSDFTAVDASGDKAGKTNPCAEANFTNFLRWGLNVLLAGFLIGLGGPFWYKVFTSLSHIVSVLRTFRVQPRQEAIGASSSDQQNASQPLVKAVERIDDETGPQLVNLFRAAAGLPAKDFAKPATPTGQPTPAPAPAKP